MAVHCKRNGDAYPVETFADMKREIQEYSGVQQWPTPGAPAVLSIGGDKGKHNGSIKGELTVKFAGQCFVCGKTRHRQSRRWCYDGTTTADSPSPSGQGKTGKKGNTIRSQTTQVLEGFYVSDPNLVAAQLDIQRNVRKYHKTSQHWSNNRHH